MRRSEKRRQARASIWGKPEASKRGGSARPYLGVRFACCGIYLRIYRNRERTAYEGRCPKCMRPIRVLIGGDGTPDRFFNAW